MKNLIENQNTSIKNFLFIFLFFTIYFYLTQVYILKHFENGFSESLTYIILLFGAYVFSYFNISLLISTIIFVLFIYLIYVFILFYLLKKKNFGKNIYITTLLLLVFVLIFQMTTVSIPYLLISIFKVNNADNILNIVNIKVISPTNMIFVMKNNIQHKYTYFNWSFLLPKMFAICFNLFLLFIFFPIKNLKFKKYKINRKDFILLISLLAFLLFQGWIFNFIFKNKWSFTKFDISIYIISAILEELLFRGFILSKLEKTKNFYLSNMIQSFLFCSAHFLMTNIYMTIPLFIGGLNLGFIYKKYDLKMSITFHLLYNLLFAFIFYKLGIATFIK